MMKFLTAAALTTLLAAPTFAQTQQRIAPDDRAQAHVAFPAPEMPADEATEAYAAYPDSGYGNVIVHGEVIGRDPDPNIRLQLERDHDYFNAN